MKKYRSHKVVEAGEVFAVKQSTVSGELVFILEDGEQVDVPADITARKGCESPVGMMLVRYEDDYLSLSPKDVFESGYKILENGSGGTVTGVAEAVESLGY